MKQGPHWSENKKRLSPALKYGMMGRIEDYKEEFQAS